MRTDQVNVTHSEALVLVVSLELAAAKWKVALHDGRRDSPAVHTVAQPQAGSRPQAVLTQIEQQKEKWGLPTDVRVVARTRSGSVVRCRLGGSNVMLSIPGASRLSATSGARSLNGIGPVGGSRLALKLFWRQFNHRRQLGACVGLAPQPFDSGDSQVDQGITAVQWLLMPSSSFATAV